MWRIERSKASRFLAGLLAVLVAGLAGNCGAVLAQTPPAPPRQDQSQSLDPRQLDNLVAPIALYPDPLLGQVLVASTYPVELVEAQQWLQANGDLQGQQLIDAARQQNWDASVQALVAMPDVLQKLNQDIRWTTDLGNAFLAQQADVMSAVQRMRARARANGRLRSTPEENVTTERQDGQEAIQILPADPQVIYVPTYDPSYVWGPPAWGYYPPLYYPDNGFWFGAGIDIGFCFGGWGGWGWGGWGWGWGPNWFGRNVFVNNFFFNHYGYRGRGFGDGFRGRTAWAHDPSHRLGARYPNGQLASRFGSASQASRMAAGRAGNWQSFGQGNAGNRNSFGGAPSRAGTGNFQSPRASSGWQRFDGPGRSNPGSSSWGTRGPQSRYPSQGSQAPQRGFGSQAGPRSYASPGPQRGYGYQAAPRSYGYSAPQRGFGYQASPRSYQAAPRASAPSYGGGGIRSSGGGIRSSGGGGFHSSGGGGFHGGGGGGHGGRR